LVTAGKKTTEEIIKVMELEGQSTTIVDSQDENVRSILSVDSGHPPSISSLNDSGSSFDSNQEVFLSSFDNSLTSAARRVHKCRRVDPQTINSLCARLEEAVYLSRKTRELTMTNGGEGSDDPCPSSSHEVNKEAIRSENPSELKLGKRTHHKYQDKRTHHKYQDNHSKEALSSFPMSAILHSLSENIEQFVANRRQEATPSSNA
jgi:hypothetical protein